MNDKYTGSEKFIDVYEYLKSEGKVLSKKDFANKIGITPSTISEILARRQGITVDMIYKICKEFDCVSPMDFFDKIGDISIINGHNVIGDQNKINSENPTNKDLSEISLNFFELLKKKDEQIDRLLSIIERTK